MKLGFHEQPAYAGGRSVAVNLGEARQDIAEVSNEATGIGLAPKQEA